MDASAFRHLCEGSENSAGHQFRRWIDGGDGIVVFAGVEETYARELKGHSDAEELLLDYYERGCAIDIDARRIVAAQSDIPGRPVRQSNDPHILALAVASGATVLFSCDNPLRTDFANREVIGNVGRRRRRSVPDILPSPEDTTKAPRRRKFLQRHKCPASQ